MYRNKIEKQILAICSLSQIDIPNINTDSREELARAIGNREIKQYRFSIKDGTSYFICGDKLAEELSKIYEVEIIEPEESLFTKIKNKIIKLIKE